MSAHTHSAPVAPAAGTEQAQPPAGPEVSSFRLVSVLTFSGAVAGALLVVFSLWAQPKIDAFKSAALGSSVSEVLGAPARTERLFVHQGRLVPQLPAGIDSASVERVFVGYDDQDRRIGFAIMGDESGFANPIHVLFGYDAATGRLISMKVLDQKETPGLGDKITKDPAFLGEFKGVTAPLKGVKTTNATGAANEVDMITGVTISSRTVVSIINHRVEQVKPLIDAYLKEGGK